MTKLLLFICIIFFLLSVESCVVYGLSWLIGYAFSTYTLTLLQSYVVCICLHFLDSLYKGLSR